MDDYHITSKQLVAFSLILSFIVSVISTVLALGAFGPLFGYGTSDSGLNRQKILSSILGTPAPNGQQVVRQDEQVVGVVERVTPGVVSIVASRDVPIVQEYYVDPFGNDPFFKQFFGESPMQVPQYRNQGTQKKEISSGTGFFVSSDGLIITNKHVVSDTDVEYTVFINNGEKKQAKVLARDPIQDLALIKINGSNYPAVTFGDSTKIKTGQSAIAIGNPLEFRNTVSVGVISGLHRSIVASGTGSNPEELQELIQTDAAINPGNSGGPLLNLSGEVIGVNTAMAQGAENIGFAIPINKAKFVVDSVKQNGRIIYPFLGVHYTIITREIAESKKLARDFGALLVEGDGQAGIVPNSPASAAGLKAGDILLSLNGERIDESMTLSMLIQKYHVGDEVKLHVFRDGKEFDVTLKLQERKS